MFEAFLEKIKEEGKARVVSTQDSHEIKLVECEAVITRSMQFGILLQDRPSGRTWMINIGEKKDTEEFLKKLSNSLLLAHAYEQECKDNIFSKEKEKTDGYGCGILPSIRGNTT